uniref:Triosephosphate isomerase n=1 Tax=Trieres chinensis TaxID=1514140 RepID=A0A7S1ZIH7_TRICV|mmetsp:Transcript_25990/g.53178  ORF Transcript_25990/g.53178 Transcript_25990/m.53178 type:complete len:284 (+) Transcript_25990:99-950(+)
MKLSAVTLLATLGSAASFAPSLVGSRSSTALFGRKPFISGNWKLNPQTKEEAVALASEIASSITDDSPDADVALFVPYVFIETAMDAVDGKLQVGAEGVCPEIQGAFTGAVSASMLDSVGVQWALAGHSERRVIFGETDEYINGQCVKLIEQGMSVMLCIGESEAEYEQNLAGSVCAVQLKKGLAGISKEDLDRVTIAYEPVWAIGTGKVATPDVAQKVHAECRSILAGMYDQEAADSIRILYGGSVTPESVDELMAQPDIDGCLVGGASLDSAKFSRIINFQ